MNGTLFFQANDGTNGTELWSMSVNSRPLLTAFAAAVDTTFEDMEVELTFADLSAQGDEFDADGTVDAFIVQAVVSGTLKIGTTAGNATAFAVGSNDRINGTLKGYWTPAANAHGNAIAAFTVLAQDNIGDRSNLPVTATVTVTAVADTPSVTNTSTSEDVQTTSGLVIARNAVDGAEVTHFRITSITGGSLFQNDGTTAIANNEFITFAQANAGLKFTPSLNSSATGHFTVQASTSNANSGLGGSTVTADITVNPIAETPGVTNASTNEDVQSTTGLVISRNAADGAEVTHFKITSITGGTLFQNDGTTAIANNQFITFAQANAGLKFTPSLNSSATGHFTVQASISNANSGLGGSTVTADITVNPVADTPGLTNASTMVNVQTTSGLVISRNAADGAEVTHFKITSITGGSLFQTDGTTAISNNEFITIAQGNAGLKFTPGLNSVATGHFTVQASTSNVDGGLGGPTATANITVTILKPAITAPAGSTASLRPTIMWSSVPGAVSYEVWINNLSTGANPFHTATVNSASYVPTVDLGIGDFRVWVRAKAGNVVSAWSGSRDFRITTAVTLNAIAPVQTTLRPTLSWSALPGAASYEVWINNLSTGANPFHTATVNSASYVPTVNLGIGNFRVWVRAKAGNVVTAWSGSRDFRITTAVTLNAIAPVQTTFRPTLSWSALPGADHYDVWIDNLSTGTSQVVRNNNVKRTSFTVATNLPVGSYRAWVRGIAKDNTAANWSLPANFGIGVAPTITQGQNASFDRIPEIRWNELPGATRYDVWINNLSTGTSQVVRNANVTPITFTGPNTLPIGSYRAWVRGIAADGYATTWTSPVNFKIHGAPTRIAGPYSTFDNTPVFAWNAVIGASKYDVFIRNLATGATTINQSGITTTVFTPGIGLADGTYRWWVRAETTQGFKSLWSSEGDIVIGGRTALLTPTGTTSDTTPTFTWQNVQGIGRYDLWVDRVGGQSQIIRQQSLTSATYTPTTPLAAGTYRVWVRAIATTGQTSIWSPAVEFTIADNGSFTNGLDQLPASINAAESLLPPAASEQTLIASRHDEIAPARASAENRRIFVTDDEAERSRDTVVSNAVLKPVWQNPGFPPVTQAAENDAAAVDALMAEVGSMSFLHKI